MDLDEKIAELAQLVNEIVWADGGIVDQVEITKAQAKALQASGEELARAVMVHGPS